MIELDGLLEEKAALLRGMLAETKKIGELLLGRDLEGLNGAVAARQACIEKIDAVDRRADACAKGGAAASGRPMKEIRALLGEILDADSANMKAAGEITITLMNGIKEVNAEKNLLKYHQTMRSGSRFVNREG